MQRAMSVEIIQGENDQVAGFILMPSGWAEHESGIDRLLRWAGIRLVSDPEGIGSRSAEEVPLSLDFNVTAKVRLAGSRKHHKVAVLQIGPSTISPRAHFLEAKNELCGWWDQSGFAISAHGDAIPHLQALADAIRVPDLAIWLGGAGGNPFARDGLVIAMPSRVRAEDKAHMLASDQARNELKRDALATGIEQKIAERHATMKGSGFRSPYGFFALAPGRPLHDRIGLPNPIETRHNVMFFLNPHDQQGVNSGWFTVEELEAWLEGKGPALKSNWQRPDRRPTTAAAPAR
ncbi:conserved hypothetical protein [Hyphomicrobiales bacterium]|jgi:hypothetical protein|nr:conserved hypothetical protein [Hyphomicrobiales bacterium]CAH1702532.1 conserved hypothetical protein [Hyphomicrobiales bacterium]CAI0346734.1 conserved hypothetical protein [Hyphomicrobiales bacterium]